MNKLLTFAFLIIIFNKGISQAKQYNAQAIVFKDTVGPFAFDSITNNLGNRIESENIKMVKHFKYIGKDTIFIKKQISGDPHFICDFPKEPIIPQRVYSFSICFWHKNQRGYLNKTMCLDFSNEKSVCFYFKGRYLYQE